MIILKGTGWTLWKWTLPMKYVNCTQRVRTNVLVGKMREHRAVLYTANGCVTQTRLRVCLVHNSMAFANQQGLYAC